jgi:hypothetical protein
LQSSLSQALKFLDGATVLVKDSLSLASQLEDALSCRSKFHAMLGYLLRFMGKPIQ